MNVKLLRKVQKHILKEPRRINMNTITRSVSRAESPCGTVGCIAGWTCVLSGISGEIADLNKAQELLGLTLMQRDRLFAEPRFALWDIKPASSYTAFWPAIFARQYEEARTPKEKAKAVFERIDHFIATKGKE